jgi:hypothetical protein
MHGGKPCAGGRDTTEDRAGEGDERCRDAEVLSDPTGCRFDHII